MVVVVKWWWWLWLLCCCGLVVVKGCLKDGCERVINEDVTMTRKRFSTKGFRSIIIIDYLLVLRLTHDGQRTEKPRWMDGWMDG